MITATLHNLSPQTQERIYWIHDRFICCRIKLCTKLHNMEPDICDLWHFKSIYFWSTDTLCIQWPFPLHKVGVAFLIYESNQDRPSDFVMSCWQSLCSCSNGSSNYVILHYTNHIWNLDICKHSLNDWVVGFNTLYTYYHYTCQNTGQFYFDYNWQFLWELLPLFNSNILRWRLSM